MNNILNKLEMTNPEDLLPEDQYILGVDPEKLINTSSDRRQVWLANFETAVAAADHKKRKQDENSDDDEDDRQPHHLQAPPSQSCFVIQAGQRWRN